MDIEYSDRPQLIVGEGRDIYGIPEAALWQSLDSHGAILFRGFDLEPNDFYQFASQLSRGFIVSPFPDRKLLSTNNELQTVTLGNSGIHLHFEFGSSPLRPDLLWLFCRRPAADAMGGETLVADGVALFEKLCQSTQRMLLQRRIKYRNMFPRAAFDKLFTYNNTVRSIVGVDVVRMLNNNKDITIINGGDNKVAMEFTASPVRRLANGRTSICQSIFTDAYRHPSDDSGKEVFSTMVTWDNGDELSRDLSDEVREAAYSLTRGIRWKANDFAVIDNTRVLHGRNVIKDPQRDVLILCSFSNRYVFPPGRGG